MGARASTHSPRSLSGDGGFTLVEVLIAAVVLAIGVLGLVGTFDSARKLTLLSERRTAMAHRAELEMERLQTYPYSELAMASAPAHSSEKTNPDYYVYASGPASCSQSAGDGCYAWNGENTGEEESLVPATSGECTSTPAAGCGVVAASPVGRSCSEHVGACEWSDGLVEGKVYDFVTWHSDKHCGSSCATKENYKRLIVVVTAKVPSGNHEPAWFRATTLITEAS
jgi:prepilin-type N-terminal cleavage/methylation domain-containing protein